MKGKTSTSPGIARRIVACACSAALGVALLPAAAFAAGGSGSGSGSSSSEPTVISVVMKDATTGSEISLKKGKYTQTQLDEMAAQNSGTKSYVFSKAGGTVVSTNKYVTLDQLLAPTGDKWAAGSTVTFEDSTGYNGNGAVSYEDVTATQYFYPEGTTTGPAGTPETTSVVIGLNEASGTLGSSTASDIVNSFTDASYDTKNSPRVYYGVASGQNAYPPGKPFVSNVSKITVTYPHPNFQVLARDAATKAETTLATYTDEQLAELAKSNTTTLSYLYGSGVYTTSSYVTLDQLIGSDDHWIDSSSVEINTPDNFATTFTYAEATAKRYFYPEYTNDGKSTSGSVEVPAVVGLSYKAGTLSGTSTAQDVATASLSGADASGTPRFFIGNTDASSILAGKFSPQNVCTVTIIYDSAKYAAAQQAKADAVTAQIAALATSPTQSAIDAATKAYNALSDGQKALVTNYASIAAAQTALNATNAQKTKAAQDQAAAQLQEDSNATTTAKKANTVKLGKSKVTVKAGKKAKVAVKKAKGTVTVKSSKKKVAKVSYSKKTGKLTIKGVKKGTAKITVKAAGTSTYKSGKKIIKVTVK